MLSFRNWRSSPQVVTRTVAPVPAGSAQAAAAATSASMVIRRIVPPCRCRGEDHRRAPRRNSGSALPRRRRQRREGAEADEDAARHEPLRPYVTVAPAQPFAERARDEGVRAVADEAESGEDQPEQQDLLRRPAAGRVDELRQEREEEERGLRVEDVD